MDLLDYFKQTSLIDDKSMLWNSKINSYQLIKQIYMQNTNQTKHYPGDFSVLLKSYSSIHWPELARVNCKLQHILSHNHYVQNVVEEKYMNDIKTSLYFVLIVYFLGNRCFGMKLLNMQLSQPYFNFFYISRNQCFVIQSLLFI